MRRLSTVEWLAVALVGLVVSVWFALHAGGPFRIDETHKISETVFWRLLRAGEISAPEWFAHPVDRANPPVGKFLFGASIEIHGVDLPTDPAPGRPSGAGLRDRAAEQLHRARLIPVRRVSALATGVTAAVLVAAALLLHGRLAALLTLFFYLGSELVRYFATTAVFDPLLTLFVTATLLPLLMLWHSPPLSRAIGATAAAALFAALAWQTRVSGLLALGAIGLMLIAAAVRGQGSGVRGQVVTKSLLTGSALFCLAVIVCGIVGTAINPFYWSRPLDPRVEPRFRESRLLPLRVAHRHAQQLQDLEEIYARERPLHPHLTPAGKFRFAAEILLSDWTGLAMAAGLLLAIYLRLRGASRQSSTTSFALLWSAAIAGGIILWLPFPWPRYLLLALPPLALLGAIGWSDLVHAGRTVPRA